MLSAIEIVSTALPLPFQAGVHPYSEVLLLRIRPTYPGRGLRFSTQSTFSVGSFHAIPDPRATYRLPFANGRSFVISQASGGPLTTHTTDDSEHAVDFTMPENTPVVAARDGVVIETEAANRFGGNDKVLLAMANYVRILHADETVATYAHLAPGGVRVRDVYKRQMKTTIISLCGALCIALGTSSPALADNGHDRSYYRPAPRQYGHGDYRPAPPRYDHDHRRGYGWAGPAALLAITGIAAGIAASTYYAPAPAYVSPQPAYVCLLYTSRCV